MVHSTEIVLVLLVAQDLLLGVASVSQEVRLVISDKRALIPRTYLVAIVIQMH